jgi:DegV family protein with EDD domain
MKIRYLNGNRLYYAFLAGGDAVIQDQNYLNRINVFPVPDADTGTNLASTMRSITEGASPQRSIRETLRSIADTALTGARGNSGIIFAQFLLGFSREVKNRDKLSTQSFGEAVHRAVKYAYQAMAAPVEGTMLTVIRDWAEAVYQQRTRQSDFSELLSYSLRVAHKSLKDTPNKLKVLARAGVVDAGAKGFVDFLEGVAEFIKRGKLKVIDRLKSQALKVEFPAHSHRSRVEQRYCAEALLTGSGIDLDRMRQHVQVFGSSAIVAGSEDKARIHVHTDRPDELFSGLQDFGVTTQIKVDDMRRQFEAGHARKFETALVTDSACDLPPEMLDEFQIHVIPFNLSFGDNLYLDKVTIKPEKFYSLLKSEREHPKSAQPSQQTVQNMLAFLAGHYKRVIAVHIADGLTGIYKSSLSAQRALGSTNVHVIDSRNISVSQGLLVLRIAEAIRDGMGVEDILAQAEDWISKILILVDVATLKYFVRGGRVSPLKGQVARLLHVKPILSLNAEGKSYPFSKSFSRNMTERKIMRAMAEMTSRGRVWNYAVVHALNPGRARTYVDKMRALLDREPAYVMGVSPVIGVHSGIGAVAVSVMLE